MKNHTFKIFLIVISVIIALSLVYLYIYRNNQLEAADSPLSSSSESNINTGSQTDSNLNFISTLSSIKKINIDPNFFNSNIFISLKDNSVDLESVTPGRVNPFSPIDTNNLSFGGVSVITNDPSQVSSNSAILNGYIDLEHSFSSLYFEYGKTPNLDNKTENIEPTITGSFMANISNLSSKTTYYYRSAVDMGDGVLYGELVSFTTN